MSPVEQLEVTLVEVLLEQTKQSNLDWQETGDEVCFLVAVRDGIVEINKDNSGEVFLVVLDRLNKEIERIQPAEEPARTQLQELWDLVCRSTRNTNQKLLTIIQQLREKKPSVKPTL